MRFVLMILAFALAPLMAAAQTEGLRGAALIYGGADAAGRPLAALSLALLPEWKTYWRAPGEGGIPPQFDWSGSENLANISVLWPRPQVWNDAGTTNIGYHDAVVLPFAVTPVDAARSVTLRGRVTFGLCKDICIPVEVQVSAEIPPQSPPNLAIQQALANLPQSAQAAGVTAVTCRAQPIKDGLTVTADLALPPLSGPQETVVIEHQDSAMWLSSAISQRSGETLTAVADIVPPQAKPFDLNGADLRITVLGDSQAVEILGCPLR